MYVYPVQSTRMKIERGVLSLMCWTEGLTGTSQRPGTPASLLGGGGSVSFGSRCAIPSVDARGIYRRHYRALEPKRGREIRGHGKACTEYLIGGSDTVSGTEEHKT